MKMYNIDRAIDLIKSFEGLKLSAYLCPAGQYTIGYGHTAGVKEGDTCTELDALNMLYSDVSKVRKQMDNSIAKNGLNFSECQYNALLSFTYNCGIGNFNKLVKDRTNTEIGKAILLYNKANGVALRGLTRRRQTESELYFSEDKKTVTAENIKVSYKVRDNYRIRSTPSMAANTIAFTDCTKKSFYSVHGMSGDFVLTDKGYIHKDAFYDKIEVLNG